MIGKGDLVRHVIADRVLACLVDDPEFSRFVPRTKSRRFLRVCDHRFDYVETAPGRTRGERHRPVTVPVETVPRAVDVEVEAEIKVVIVIDGNEVRGDERAVSRI